MEHDESNSSRIVEDVHGQRRYTLNTLVDKVIRQFVEETGGREDLLSEYDTKAAQQEIVREVTNYVLAMDYVSLPPQDLAWLMLRVWKDLFRFGPLEPYLLDNTVTEISVNKMDEFFVRHGFGELERIADVQFDHPADFEQLLERVLAPIGVRLEDDPFLEVGIQLEQRPIRLSLVGPPIQSFYTGMLRLHPATPIPLDAILPAEAADLVHKISAAGHGLLVAGEVGVMKTSLLGHLIPEDKSVVLVERAREIRQSFLPDGTIIISDPAQSFSDRLKESLTHSPDVIVIDEIRGDEGEGFWDVLNGEAQLIAAIRGKTVAPRLHSAFSMGIRKAYHTIEQETVNAALMAKFPFVMGLTVPIGGTEPRFEFLGQWADDMGLEPLLHWQDDAIMRTDIQPRQALG
ncbi:MAG: Flp pilus assembly complex ATPase component TadA [Chloroflexi bacterium]|nr:Flp pilus assembly complex ATPase component TadA [Chloroflexota bacterium]